MSDLKELLTKYYNRGARYSYFPAYRTWNNEVDQVHWLSSVSEDYISEEGIDLYVHIPFCETLCTFCGCNIKVTKDFSKADAYINTLLKEWSSYTELIPNIKVSSLYFGGGTPNFLTAEQLDRLISTLIKCNDEKEVKFQGTIEVDPRRLNKEQLQILQKHKFQRISLGVQDFDQKVLQNVNRVHSTDLIQEKINDAKEFGFAEVMSDLIYGLPYQTEESFQSSVKTLIDMNVDSIALYPLAPVPWQKAGQEAYGVYEPLTREEKATLYSQAIPLIERSGYSNLGMGHFFKTDSPTGKAFRNGKVRRTIMGFSPTKTNQLIGLGVGAISISEKHLWQNEKIPEKYSHLINTQKDAGIRSHHQTNTEHELQNFYEQLICLGKASGLMPVHEELYQKLLEDKILIKEGHSNKVTDLGRTFLKQICQSFDPYFSPE